MSDEVKQAAERIMYADSKQDWVVPQNQGMDTWQIPNDGLIEDAWLVADWVVDQHANDAENALPLSSEILQASGWVEKRDEFDYQVWSHHWVGFLLRRLTNGEWGLVCEHVDGFAMVGDTVKTVGGLRDVMRGLETEVVMVVPKGGE